MRKDATPNEDPIVSYHSKVHYVRHCLIHDTDYVEKIGHVPTLAQVDEALLWLGELPLREYVYSCGLPKWFASKYKRGFRRARKRK